MSEAEKPQTEVESGYPSGVTAVLSDSLRKEIGDQLDWATDGDVAKRIWAADHTLWKPDPDEITDRLGWLGISEQMLALKGDLEAFADDVRSQGFTHCALLGMGGSSLAP